MNVETKSDLSPYSRADRGGHPIWNTIGWLFGAVAVVIGVINMIWGNDPEYGVFIFLLAFAFFPPVDTFLKAKTGYRIHPVLKVVLGLFIVWSALGVGELPDKVDMMLKDLRGSISEIDPSSEIELL